MNPRLPSVSAQHRANAAAEAATFARDEVPPVNRSVAMTLLVRKRCPLHDVPLIDRSCHACSPDGIRIVWLRNGYVGIGVIAHRLSDGAFMQHGIPEVMLRAARTDMQTAWLGAMREDVIRMLPELAADGDVTT